MNKLMRVVLSVFLVLNVSSFVFSMQSKTQNPKADFKKRVGVAFCREKNFDISMCLESAICDAIFDLSENQDCSCDGWEVLQARFFKCVCRWLSDELECLKIDLKKLERLSLDAKKNKDRFVSDSLSFYLLGKSEDL